MIEFPPAPDHVFAVRVTGTLDADEYDTLVAALEAKLARHDRVGVYADLTGFDDITLRAGAKDLRYSFSKLFQLKRFPREAVVTDKEWIRSLARMADPILPVEIKAFDPAGRETALAWAGGFAR